jgi:hypothetical protein
MQDRGLTARLGYYGGGVMTANVVEGSQGTVVTADHYDGLSRDGSGDELPRGLHLVDTRHELPRFAEHAESLKFRDARIDIPFGRNGGGLRQWSAVVVAGKDLLD